MDFLQDIILKGIMIVIWTVIVQGPLLLIAAVENVFTYLTTGIVWDILFNGQKAWNLDNIPTSFWAFCIVSLFMAIIIFIFQYLTYSFNEEINTKLKLVKTLKSTGLALVFVFFIPIGFYATLILLDFLQGALKFAFGKDEVSLADMLYKIGDNTWDGSTSGIKANYAYPSNIVPDYNMLVEILSVIFMLYALVNLSMAVVIKSVELFTLFLLGPITACWMVNDNGARMKSWKDDVFSKSFGSLATIISYMIMTNFLIMFLSISVTKFDFFERQFMLVIVILAVGVFATTAPVLISKYLGAEGISHADSAAMNSMGGKFLRTGGKALGAALGVGLITNKLLKNKGKSAMGGLGSAASNMLGMGGDGGGNLLSSGKENLAKAQEMNSGGFLHSLYDRGKSIATGLTVAGASAIAGGAIYKGVKWMSRSEDQKLLDSDARIETQRTGLENKYASRIESLRADGHRSKAKKLETKYKNKLSVIDFQKETNAGIREERQKQKNAQSWNNVINDAKKNAHSKRRLKKITEKESWEN